MAREVIDTHTLLGMMFVVSFEVQVISTETDQRKIDHKHWWPSCRNQIDKARLVQTVQASWWHQ